MDWLRSFSPEFAARLRQGLEEAASLPRKVALFDADGTLWHQDLGEAFLRGLIASRKLLGVDCSPALYAEYEARVEVDRSAAYGWAVQLMAGLKLADIERWSEALAYAWPNYRPRMKLLVDQLHQSGFECWVISASNHWSIGVAAPRAGIGADRCQGIRTEVVGGLITDRLVQPVTCNAGKVAAAEQYVGGPAIFAFGDSMGDFEMLRHARFGMVVQQYGYPKPTLLEAAADTGWPVEIF